MIATGKYLWLVATTAYERFDGDDGSAMAGHIAYSGFLSLFPFAIFMTALVGALIGPVESALIFDALFNLTPAHVVETIRPVIEDVTGKSRGGVLTIAGLGALWVASNAVEAMRVALDRAYDSEQSGSFIRRRAIAIGFVILAMITFAMLGALIILAPLALKLAQDVIATVTPFDTGFVVGVGVVRYVLGLLVFAAFLLMVNRWLPSRRIRTKRILPGICVATVLWFLGATGFSIYLSFAPSYTVTYGAFAGVIITLLFFYLTGAAIIFGAEVNAALVTLAEAKHADADVENAMVEEDA